MIVYLGSLIAVVFTAPAPPPPNPHHGWASERTGDGVQLLFNVTTGRVLASLRHDCKKWWLHSALRH
jgi:hypothetical protein